MTGKKSIRQVSRMTWGVLCFWEELRRKVSAGREVCASVEKKR